MVLNILIKQYRNKHTIWLSESYLVRMCNVNSEYLRADGRPSYISSLPPSLRTRSILPDSGKSWRWARMNNTFYYAYANIPDRKPCFYKSMLPSEEELIQLAIEAEKPTPEALSAEFTTMAEQKTNKSDIHYYMFNAASCFNQQKAEQLALGLGFCRLISELLEGTQFKKWFKKKEDLYNTLFEQIQYSQSITQTSILPMTLTPEQKAINDFF